MLRVFRTKQGFSAEDGSFSASGRTRREALTALEDAQRAAWEALPKADRKSIAPGALRARDLRGLDDLAMRFANAYARGDLE